MLIRNKKINNSFGFTVITVLIAVVFVFSWLSVLDIYNISIAKGFIPDIKRSNKAGINTEHVLMKFKDNVSKSRKDDFLRKHRFEEKFELEQIGVKAIRVPSGKIPKEVVERIQSAGKGLIDFAEMDSLVKPGYIPNDPKYSDQWYQPKVNSPSAWDSTSGSVTIAIADTGVDSDHPDLQNNLVSGWNFYDNNSDTSDIHGHGTAVAGVAAAVGDNNNQIAGIAYSAKIMPLRISDENAYAYWSTMAEAITYAADNGAKVINISYTGSESSTVRSAAAYMKDKGGITVFAEGNSGDYVSYSNSPDIVNASAIDSSDTTTSWSTYGEDVDVAAPGSYILTTTRGGGLGNWNGTSFSAPMTAGVLGLIWSVDSSLTPDQAQKVLFDSAYDLGSEGWDVYYGWGRIDSGAAVELALNSEFEADTSDPIVQITNPGDGATLTGDVSLTADASDNVGVTKVDFYINGDLFGSDDTSPYSLNWDTTAFSDGEASFSAKAYDAAGNTGASKTLSATIENSEELDDVSPSIDISNPQEGDVISGLIKINASATDNVMIDTIKLFIDNKEINSYDSSSFSYNWNTRKENDGLHSILVKAIDTSNNESQATISVTVNNAGDDSEDGDTGKPEKCSPWPDCRK